MRAGRPWVACGMWPGLARSSLAARRVRLPSESQLPACGSSLDRSAVALGWVCARSLSPVGVAGGAARRSGWLVSSASRMAVSVSSVESGDFCGIFAISVVASSLRRTVADRTIILRGPLHERWNVRSRGHNHALYRRPAILSAWHCERSRDGKDFFIIVNFLLTMTFPARARGYSAH